MPSLADTARDAVIDPVAIAPPRDVGVRGFHLLRLPTHTTLRSLRLEEGAFEFSHG